ncbi:NAD(P)-dependent oxidoreductase [Mycolicibacterium sp. (ex Dasyatis americana)]|nr:NAD(P)-dependent oxidoreductase [Mycolicibacterium sp. (ex Dasyatis americana)]
MSIVVTGATGHLGRRVVTQLLAAGVPPEQVTAAGRQTERLADLAERGVRVAEIEFSRPETLSAAFAGAGTVLLVSGSEVGRRIDQHRNAVEAAQEAGVGRVVYTSAPRADTSALVLAPEHKATEEIIRASGLTFTILRNGWYTENYLADLEQAKVTGEIVAAAGQGRVASASRNDYADAAAVVLRTEGHDNATYELSGDVAWDFNDLAAAASVVLGRPVVYRAVPPEERLVGLLAVGLDEGTAHFAVTLEENTRDGLLAETNGELARIIGHPTTPLIEGLRAVLT